MTVPKVEHWGVDVRINGEHVLSIEIDSLSGIENITDYRDTVIECAHHLLAFIGPAEPQKSLESVPVQPPNSTKVESVTRNHCHAGSEDQCYRNCDNCDDFY